MPNGTLRDLFNLQRGYWEAKDTDDDLREEINKKRAKGYPFTNTIFEDTRRAVLFQNNQVTLDVDSSLSTSAFTRENPLRRAKLRAQCPGRLKSGWGTCADAPRSLVFILVVPLR